jgi:rare lipoprotein A
MVLPQVREREVPPIRQRFFISRGWRILVCVRKGRPPKACTAVIGIALFIGMVGCAGASPELRAGRIGAEQEGMATYYSNRLAGHRTANGERYNPSAMTAAHPFLPFGTRVRVTRLDDRHQSVVVRINDRCAGKKKIIDVSAAAARQLDMIRAGIVAVRIQVIARNTKD